MASLGAAPAKARSVLPRPCPRSGQFRWLLGSRGPGTIVSVFLSFSEGPGGRFSGQDRVAALDTEAPIVTDTGKARGGNAGAEHTSSFENALRPN